MCHVVMLQYGRYDNQQIICHVARFLLNSVLYIVVTQSLMSK